MIMHQGKSVKNYTYTNEKTQEFIWKNLTKTDITLGGDVTET